VLRGRGSPPSLVNPPSGCRFHPRCPFAMAVCKESQPPAFTVAPDQVAACWLHEPGRAVDAAADDSAATTGADAGPDPASGATSSTTE